MDLKGLSPSETAVMEIIHPVTNKKIPDVHLVVYGSDSKHYRAMIANAAREGAAAREAKEEQPDPIQLHKKTTQRLATLVAEIVGLKEDGKPITDAVKLLTDYPWIREQVDTFVMRRANFLPKA